MPIKVDANARMEGMGAMDGLTEEVFLPGPLAGDDDEGPYEFVYPRMGKILATQRRIKSMTDIQAVAESSKSTMAWLAKGFGPAAWEHITARLDDDDDILDDEHMQYLFVQLVKAGTGRPTTSSSGAVRQPWKKPSTAAPSPLESGSET